MSEYSNQILKKKITTNIFPFFTKHRKRNMEKILPTLKVAQS